MSREPEQQPPSGGGGPSALPGACREFHPLLVPYLDGEATAAERARVDAHVAGCPRCRQDLGSHRLLEGVLKDLCSPEAAAASGLTRPLLAAKVRSEDRRRRTKALWLARAAAIIITGCGCLWLWVRSGGQEGPDPEGVSHPVLTQVDGELIDNLDVLEAFEEAGIEPSHDLAQLLLEEEAGEEAREENAGLDASVFDYLLEEEVWAENL